MKKPLTPYPSPLQSFGYSSLRAILMQTPGGATTCISIYISAYLAGRFRNTRCLLLALSCLPVIVGAVIVWKGSWSGRGLPLAGYYLIPIFGAPYVLLLALSSANIAGGTKKACATGAIFVGYNVGNIIGPYLVNADEAHIKYRTTWISIIIVMCLTIGAAAVMGMLLATENRGRDRTQGSSGGTGTLEKEGEKHANVVADEKDGSVEGLMHVDRDLTDWEDQTFRYSL